MGLGLWVGSHAAFSSHCSKAEVGMRGSPHWYYSEWKVSQLTVEAHSAGLLLDRPGCKNSERIVFSPATLLDTPCSQHSEMLFYTPGLQPVAIAIPSALLISTPTINEAFSFATLQLAGYPLFLEASSVNPRDGCGIVKTPEDQQQFVKHTVQPRRATLSATNLSLCFRRSSGSREHLRTPITGENPPLGCRTCGQAGVNWGRHP